MPEHWTRDQLEAGLRSGSAHLGTVRVVPSGLNAFVTVDGLASDIFLPDRTAFNRSGASGGSGMAAGLVRRKALQ